MTRYLLVLEFNGGCFECPVYNPTLRHCNITKDRVEWHFNARAVLTFNPYMDRNESCPLICVKKEQKRAKRRN